VPLIPVMPDVVADPVMVMDPDVVVDPVIAAPDAAVVMPGTVTLLLLHKLHPTPLHATHAEYKYAMAHL
jgi:hypothetical protein